MLIMNNLEETLLDTFGGKLRVKFDESAKVTSLGQLSFFIDFLKTSGLYEKWVKECPLNYQSNNAPEKEDVLGTLLLSILSGHKRYAHVTSIRSDKVNSELLKMNKVISEDSLRRALQKMDESESIEWLSEQFSYCTDPLLENDWILDIDSTVKPIYGNQEQAKIGYNPSKPGRPSHVYHSYMIANVRLILDVEVDSGNHTSAKYSMPGLWKVLDKLEPNKLPEFIRGDCAFGNEPIIKEAEERGIDYLFKLKQSSTIKKLLSEEYFSNDWEFAGSGYEGKECNVKLTTWTKERRVILLRRRIKQDLLLEDSKQKQLAFIETNSSTLKYEYMVLVTSLDEDIITIAQHYRDRADCENNFDELKNQWGWGGFTTNDFKRCTIMAKNVALIYNWWSLFVKLSFPNKHAEAITSKPLMLNSIGIQTHHANQKRITITSLHAKSVKISKALKRIGAILRVVKSSAEQLSKKEIWRQVCYVIFRKIMPDKKILLPNLA